MRVLFDQGTPDPLRASLTLHNVSTAYEKGWLKLRNGDLLDAAEREGYEVLVSTDTNMKYQQNLSARRVGIVILLTTSWPRIERGIPFVVSAIDAVMDQHYGVYGEVSTEQLYSLHISCTSRLKPSCGVNCTKRVGFATQCSRRCPRPTTATLL